MEQQAETIPTCDFAPTSDTVSTSENVVTCPKFALDTSKPLEDQRAMLIAYGAKVTQSKKRFQAVINSNNADFAAWKDAVIAWSVDHGDLLFSVIVDEKDRETLGESGAFEVKMRNDYETMTKTNIERLNMSFFRTICPSASEEDIVKMASGHANWIWSNRERTPVKYVERTYPTATQPKKRKAENPIERPSKKAVPKTFEDFASLDIMKMWNATCGNGA